MYNVSPSMLESLKATLALQSRLEDTVLIYETHTGLELCAKNSSSTVHSRAFFSRNNFADPIANERVHCIPANTLDRVLSSVPHKYTEFTMEFKDKLYLEIVYTKIHRSHQIDLLDITSEEPRGPLSVYGSNAFTIKVEMLREILTHFSPAAELVELYLDSSEIIRWRGYRNPKRNSKSDIYTKIDSTAIMHYSDMFVGLDAEAPWRAEFRLKELRLAVTYFDKVCTEQSKQVHCVFNESGAPLMLILSRQLEVFSLKFETCSKSVSSPPLRFNWNEVLHAASLDLPYTPPTQQEPEELLVPQPPNPESPPPAKRPRPGDSLSVDTQEVDESAFIDPGAEIQSTQQERVPGLFD